MGDEIREADEYSVVDPAGPCSLQVGLRLSLSVKLEPLDSFEQSCDREILNFLMVNFFVCVEKRLHGSKV